MTGSLHAHATTNERPWRYRVGTRIVTRNSRPDDQLVILYGVMHTVNGIHSPHYVCRDVAGDDWLISQLEISEHPLVRHINGTVTVSRSPQKVAA